MAKKQKPRANTPQENAEEVKPRTPKEILAEVMDLTLKEAGVARTSSITLSGLEFAEDLSKVLLNHVTSVEKLFKEVQQVLRSKESTEKDFKRWTKKVQEKSDGTKKLQARPN